jgi:hypothetical protein
MLLFFFSIALISVDEEEEKLNLYAYRFYNPIEFRLVFEALVV